MFQSKSHSRSAGQATVESVLLIALTVIIALSLMVVFFQPLNRWLDNYMGSYLTCLIDVGELPNLGANQEGQCDAQYENFTLADGRPPIPVSPRPSDPGESDGRGNPPRRSNPSDSSGSGRSASGARNRLSDSSRFGFSKGTGADGAASSKETRQELPEELSQTSYFRAQTRISVEGQTRVKRIPATGVTGLLKEEKEKRERELSRVSRVEAGSDVQTKSKKFVVKPQERKIASEAEIEPWNFGRILKWAVIILVILAILVFVGGQVLQISKSMEK